jgi:hypothetical protein
MLNKVCSNFHSTPVEQRYRQPAILTHTVFDIVGSADRISNSQIPAL